MTTTAQPPTQYSGSAERLLRSRAAQRRRVVFTVAGGLVLLAVLVATSVAIGSNPLTPAEVWRGLTALDGSRESLIVWELRMPRTALALVVGGALAVAGVLMQALTRNPLAEPGILGVNAGAAFAVVTSITLLGLTQVHQQLWFALLGAAAAAGFAYTVSLRRTHRSDHARLVLAGAALSASLGACTGIITLFNSKTFSSYRFWVIGSVANRGPEVLMPILPLIAVGLVLALTLAPSLNALALGEEQATALGARLGLIRVLAFVAITLLCGAATAAAGPIGFVGLVVPHTLRLLIGADQRTVLALSVLAGPALVLLADIVGRVVTRPGELEVGVVTAFIGAPVLLALLLDRSWR
ncbi:MAG: iron ABC transporter permease [Propioniciclava sp.]|uniref:FecCD family ABC transporter permease n=1 Tax=Propioniciclava sp. TaxID=2038686 RepID=UPI0039E25235